MASVDLPKEYKVAAFESKGAPLTFKQVKLELPKPGEVRILCPISSFTKPPIGLTFLS